MNERVAACQHASMTDRYRVSCGLAASFDRTIMDIGRLGTDLLLTAGRIGCRILVGDLDWLMLVWSHRVCDLNT